MNLAKSHGGQSDTGGPGEDLIDLVVRSYTPIGTLNGIGYASAQVEAREGMMPGRHLVTRSVRVELTSGGDYPQVSAAAVAYENVDRLMAAIQRLRTATIRKDRFQFTELEFEVDDLKVIVFNTDHGGLMFGLSAESVSIHFNDLSKLEQFQTLLEKAKDHLDTFGRVS
jgi:hypothetical protein